MKTITSPLVLAAALLALAPLANAQNLFVNGGLEGPSPGNTRSIVAPDWQAVPASVSFSQATFQGFSDTPDLSDINGPILSANMSGTPYDGNTFMSGVYGFAGSDFFDEGIRQSVFLEAGTSYTIELYQAIMLQQSISTATTGGWQIYLGNSLLGTTDFSTTTRPFEDRTLDWEYRSLEFTPTTTGNQFISFMPHRPEPNERVTRVAIDGISLMETALIPEPSGAVLLGITGTLALLRRRRSA